MQFGGDFNSGELVFLKVNSEALSKNMLGDPTERKVGVYLPHGTNPEGLPLLVSLAGYTGSGLSQLNWKNFGENVPERLDRLMAKGDMPPAVIAFPDCYTRLGGNQYINSVAMGNWEEFLTVDLLDAIESRFGCGGAGRRGLFGKSSGGYGALIHAMRHPDVWSAIACHSGDMGFDIAYQRDFPATLRALAKYEMSYEGFVRALWSNHNPSHSDIHALMILAMGATYDPDPNAFCGIRLPVDLRTCEVDQARWAKWQAWDPLQMFDSHAEALRSLKALWVDCGDQDQFDFVYVARRLKQKLDTAQIPHHYEEFPDNHFGLDYRFDKSLPQLVRALQP